MCRNTLSVFRDGRVFDCDFNQMLELGVADGRGGTLYTREFDPATCTARRVVTGRHCFGCTAGAGSSCGGAIAETAPGQGRASRGIRMNVTGCPYGPR